MSDVLYDSHPSLVRMKPLSTTIAALVIVFGIVVAVAGGSAIGLSLGEEQSKFVQIGGLILAGAAFILLMSWWLSTRTDHLVIKEDEIVWTHGIMNKQYTEISMSSVRTVRVEQGLLERMLGVGKVSVFTSGDIPELVVKGMPDPDSIRELVKAQGSGESSSE